MLTPAQLTALKADIAANANTIDFGGQVQIKDLPNSNDANNEIALQWYRKMPASDFFGNYARVPAESVFNAINWKNYTMADLPAVAAVPSAPTTAETYALNLHVARATFANGFAMNLQTMLIGRTNIDATKSSMVSGIKDATNADMPTGANGASLKGGWAGIQKILCRKGNNIEKLLATITAGTGTGADDTHAAVFTYEQIITGDDITQARNSP